jgi:hypothetical protein
MNECQKKIQRRCFGEWKRMLQRVKKAMLIFSNYETLYFFYRTAVGFKFIKQKADFLASKQLAIEHKTLEKNLEGRLTLLDKDTK